VAAWLREMFCKSQHAGADFSQKKSRRVAFRMLDERSKREQGVKNGSGKEWIALLQVDVLARR
jgi:hypothetical protein